MAVARASTIILNVNGHPVLVPDLEGKQSFFNHLQNGVSLGDFFEDIHHQVQIIPLYSDQAKSFIIHEY